jgi:hemoglobin-like flavoprotein
MPLDASTAHRFQSSVARLQPQFDRVAQRFFERLGRDCPHVMRVIPTWNKRNRFDMAAAFAEIVKHVERPGARLARLQHAFLSVGLTEQDFRIVQKALLHEVKDAAGAEWNDQLNSDWSDALHSVFSAFKPSAQPAKIRAAA